MSWCWTFHRKLTWGLFVLIWSFENESWHIRMVFIRFRRVRLKTWTRASFWSFLSSNDGTPAESEVSCEFTVSLLFPDPSVETSSVAESGRTRLSTTFIGSLSNGLTALACTAIIPAVCVCVCSWQLSGFTVSSAQVQWGCSESSGITHTVTHRASPGFSRASPGLLQECSRTVPGLLQDCSRTVPGLQNHCDSVFTWM